LHHRLHGIAALQDRRDNGGIEAQFAVAGEVQQRLHLVGEHMHGPQMQEARHAFDGVK
jgi:hypothetical protein